jgi:hypothetical protein
MSSPVRREPPIFAISFSKKDKKWRVRRPLLEEMLRNVYLSTRKRVYQQKQQRKTGCNINNNFINIKYFSTIYLFKYYVFMGDLTMFQRQFDREILVML